MILCDIGNTTYHFLQNKKLLKSNIKNNLPILEQNQDIYFISVNEFASNKLLNKYPNAININNYFSLDTLFSNTMGIDRVVACSYISNSIIVDSGSAITVDIMKDSIHLGGFIMPGIDALKSSYPNISSKLEFNFQYNINLDNIPLNTNDAINYAIINMIISPIKDIQKKYNLDIIFTGENSKLIQKHFKNSKFDETLLFDSMKNAIRKNI
jgi:type III pantothenate kinase